jgi:hypothetical protein
MHGPKLQLICMAKRGARPSRLDPRLFRTTSGVRIACRCLTGSILCCMLHYKYIKPGDNIQYPSSSSLSPHNRFQVNRAK